MSEDPARLLSEVPIDRTADETVDALPYWMPLLDAAAARRERLELGTLRAAELLCRASAPSSDVDATRWLVARAGQCLR